MNTHTNTNYSKTPLDAHFGSYECVFGSLTKVWQLLYDHGEGEKTQCTVRWGKKNAKKMQSRKVGLHEGWRLLQSHRNKKYVYVKNSLKTTAEVERAILAAALLPTSSIEEENTGQRRIKM